MTETKTKIRKRRISLYFAELGSLGGKARAARMNRKDRVAQAKKAVRIRELKKAQRKQLEEENR